MRRVRHSLLYYKYKFFFKEWMNLLALLVFFVVALFAQFTATRFNGQVVTGFLEDGSVTYGSVFANIWLLPILALLVYLVFVYIPRIAVYKRNVEEFFERHPTFKLVLILFLMVIYISLLLPVFEVDVEQTYFMIPALAMMMIYMGFLLKDVHRNYFFGIRTPWTLARDDVWNKTHKFGSAVFEIIGVLLLVSLFFPGYFLEILLTSVIVGALVCVVYSYLIFSRNHH